MQETRLRKWNNYFQNCTLHPKITALWMALHNFLDFRKQKKQTTDQSQVCNKTNNLKSWNCIWYPSYFYSMFIRNRLILKHLHYICLVWCKRTIMAHSCTWITKCQTKEEKQFVGFRLLLPTFDFCTFECEPSGEFGREMLCGAVSANASARARRQVFRYTSSRS